MDSYSVEAFSYLIIGICVIALRIYTRVRQLGFRGLGTDDYFMMLTIVPFTVETVLSHLVGKLYHGLANSGMTDEERAALSPDSDEFHWRVSGSKIQVAGWPMYASVLWCIKASLACFYGRLTSGVAGYRGRVLTSYAIVGASYVIVILSYLLSCHPMEKFWQINPNPGNLCQPALSKLYVFITVCLNIVTDVYLLFIPIPMLWGTQLPTYKKISLAVIFSGGLFVISAGIVRGVVIVQNPVEGPRMGSGWAVRESFVAIVTSCLPVIWGWLKGKLKPFLGSLLSSQSKKQTGPEPGSIMLGDTNDHSGWRSGKRGGTTTNRTVISRAAPEDDRSSDSDLSFSQMIGGGSGITKQVAISVSSTKASESTDKVPVQPNGHVPGL